MVVRINDKTPNGADYFEMYYCDEDGNDKSKEEATRVIITEFNKEGKIINTTYGILNNSANSLNDSDLNQVQVHNNNR